MDQITTIQVQAKAKLPTKFGVFTIHAFTEETPRGVKEHAALVMGYPKDGCLVRVHSACVTSEVFGSLRCDCADQFEAAQRMIAHAGEGILIYLDQEGRDIGLANKIKAYALQDRGADTVEANEQLGLPIDARHYHVAVDILRHFRLNAIRLLTNNPEKIDSLEREGIAVERVALCLQTNEHNEGYIAVKRNLMGHLWVGQPSSWSG